MMFIPDPGIDYLPILDPGFKKAPYPDQQHRFQVAQSTGHFEHVEGRHTFTRQLPAAAGLDFAWSCGKSVYCKVYWFNIKR